MLTFSIGKHGQSEYLSAIFIGKHLHGFSLPDKDVEFKSPETQLRPFIIEMQYKAIVHGKFRIPLSEFPKYRCPQIPVHGVCPCR